MRRKSELLRRLADGSMTEEDRQAALRELGLHDASEEELKEILQNKAAFMKKLEDERRTSEERRKGKELGSKDEEDMERKADLLRKLEEGNLSEEEKQKALNELGLSESRLQDALNDKEAYLRELAKQKAAEVAVNG